MIEELEASKWLYNSLYANLVGTRKLREQDIESLFISSPDTMSKSEERLFAAMRTYSLGMYDTMYTGWTEMVFNGEFSMADRDARIRTSQLMLASQCLRVALVRARHVDIKADFRYFSKDLEAARRVMNGVMNEYDTAITLLELSRTDPDLKIVNAPLRFEGWAGNANADFIAYHSSADSVIGIQAKSGQQARDARYDQERVLLIDGARDLKGHAMHRTRPGSSSLSDVLWPGLISSEIVARMPLHGRHSATQNNTGLHMSAFLNLRRVANDTLRLKYGSGNQVSGTLQYAKKSVGDKLYAKLGAEKPQHAPTHPRSAKTSGRRK